MAFVVPVLATVSEGPSNAVGALQLVRTNINDKIIIFLNIKFLKQLSDSFQT